jgi:hypothetical protein
MSKESKEKKDSTKLPEGITLAQLKENWDICTREYARAYKRARLLDATDRGRLWESVKAKFPAYQILPDTNFVSYVKTNLVASIYTVCKGAHLIPTTQEDMELITHINNWIDHYWDVGGVKDIQQEAGDRAALMNLGITQVGWDRNVSGGTGSSFFKGMPSLKNIDPLKWMRDPYATSLETAGYCILWDQFHKSVFQCNPLYKEAFKQYLASSQAGAVSTTVPTEAMTDGPAASQINGASNYHRLIIHWVRNEEMYHEIHTIDNKFVLHVTEDIKPSAFPFAELYCNKPAGDLIGTSEPAKIFSNAFAYNLLNSIMMTAEYKNQRPPKFINTQSGLNIAAFVKHGNEADYTFVVNGDATKAAHYHQFPLPSAATPVITQQLSRDVKSITGVDERYTGRDTGSILTTGGIESMLDQVTMVDAPKVANYEKYTKRLTQLILMNMIEFGGKRSYFVKVPNSNKYESVEIDFPKLNKDTLFCYAINISSELPKNKARIAQMATTLMEKQMQYAQSGQKVNFITPEEWLMFQDLPNKEFMFERMGIERSADYTERVSEILMTFAELTKQGMPPQEAIAVTAAQMQANDSAGMIPVEVPGAMPEGVPAPPPEAVQGGMPPQMNTGY